MLIDTFYYQMQTQQHNGNWKLCDVYRCDPKDFSAMCEEKTRIFAPIQIRFVRYRLDPPDNTFRFKPIRTPPRKK